MAVRSGHEDAWPQRCVRKHFVGSLQRGKFVGAAVLGERRLVELHTRSAAYRELFEEPLVLLEQPVEQIECRESVLLGSRRNLRQQQQRHGAEHDGPKFDALGHGTIELVEQRGRIQSEDGVLVEFRLAVVVVAPEPADEFEGREVCAATAHREVEIEWVEFVDERTESLRDRTEQQCVVEHVVVVGERVAGDLRQSGGEQFTPHVLLQFATDRDDLGAGAVPVPVGIESTLEFTTGSDARVTENARAVACHAGIDLSLNAVAVGAA